MLLWYWVYENNPQEIFHREERSPPASVIARFDEAARLGMRDGSAVRGMWLSDEVPDQDDRHQDPWRSASGDQDLARSLSLLER